MKTIKTLPIREALGRLVLPSADEHLFSSKDWLQVLINTYNSKLFVKYIEENGKVTSWVMYSKVKNFLEWKICVCSYCDYFDSYVNSAKEWHDYFLSFREDYPEYRIAIRSLRDKCVQQCPDFHVLSKEYYHCIDLKGSLKEIEGRFIPSFKRACQKAERHGIVVRPCKKEELKKFYYMHFNLRKTKYRLFAQPYRFFEIIWEQFIEKDRGVMLGAFTSSGEMIAANIYLIAGKTLYYKFGTSSSKDLEMRPNNLIMKEAIMFAKSRNLDLLDLGSSGLHQDGLVQFKTHICQGTEQMNIVHLGFEPPGYKFSRKIILGVITKFCTIRWMPDFIGELGAKIIYPYLA